MSNQHATKKTNSQIWLEAVRQFAEKSREEKVAMMQRAGIIDREGNLTEIYKPSQDETKENPE